jgi:squalene-associated FAD-dependent desaturase
VTGIIHIVGAGIAGLSAAVAAVAAGRGVRLYEAAPQAGGRCRTVTGADGFSHDNGAHVLLSANRNALGLIDRIGARDAWIEPEPEGLPVYDACTGALSRIGLSPWSWIARDKRPPGLSLADLPRLARLAAPLAPPLADRPIGALFGESALHDHLIEPLTVAVLNTPVSRASSARLGRALRRVIRPGGARLMVARNGLGPDLVDAAIAWLVRQGVVLRTGMRLRAVEAQDDRAAALGFAGETITLAPRDSVILALPPNEIGRLFPQIAVPHAFEPIINAHFALDPPLPATDTPRFIGLVGTLSQWVLVRADHLSVTVSAAEDRVADNPESLLAHIEAEITPALAAAGLSCRFGESRRLVKEKRATMTQDAGGPVYRPVAPLRGLAFAGDWIGPLPATIEAAAISGSDAAAALTGMRR